MDLDNDVTTKVKNIDFGVLINCHMPYSNAFFEILNLYVHFGHLVMEIKQNDVLIVRQQIKNEFATLCWLCCQTLVTINVNLLCITREQITFDAFFSCICTSQSQYDILRSIQISSISFAMPSW